ncbi:hypothetical protein [Adhaeribacter soli]|uniref:Uncharacterized protein n=1 Tax=Adhaeribacter soli TaxID=2607655 RepID=A0A5N1IXT2_9BACT|nr:hypothetical protein [Adhaeribacter soli]KAA9332863.1 hypothetical protein F0P94_12780 [Adhaeribacter soli]
MNSKNLSFGFAFYGLILLGSAAFCFRANSLTNSFWLGAFGFGVMTWSHFMNRRHYWGFSAMVGQLFLNAAALAWNVLAFFRIKGTGFTPGMLNENGLMLYGSLFALTVVLLLVSASSAEKIKRELL